MKSVKWFNREIGLDDIYFLYFPDKKEALTEEELVKKYPEYCKARSMPGAAGLMLVTKLSPEKNPNVMALTGRELLEITRQNAYIPQFDQEFVQSHKLTLMKAAAMDFYIKHSRILRKQNS